MAVKSKCARCPKPAVEGSTLCERHNKTPQYFDREAAAKRASARIRTPRKRQHTLRRDPKWHAMSRQFLSGNAFCVRCLLREETKGGPLRKAAVHADHILPVHKYPEKKYDINNLQALCRRCHSIKSVMERGGRYADYEAGIIYTA